MLWRQQDGTDRGNRAGQDVLDGYSVHLEVGETWYVVFDLELFLGGASLVDILRWDHALPSFDDSRQSPGVDLVRKDSINASAATIFDENCRRWSRTALRPKNRSVNPCHLERLLMQARNLRIDRARSNGNLKKSTDSRRPHRRLIVDAEVRALPKC